MDNPYTPPRKNLNLLYGLYKNKTAPDLGAVQDDLFS